MNVNYERVYMRFLVCVLCGLLLAPTVWASDVAVPTKNGQVNTEEFHISPAYLPDHQIGESGPLIMDTTERKTTRYSNVDAVNSAINAVAVSNINNDMHTNGKAPLTAVLAIAASVGMTIICTARTCFMTTVSRANIDA